MKLDPHGQSPLYLQLRRLIMDRVNSGAYAIGTRLTSEVQLARQLGISRATVRQAITDLVKEGILFRVIGKGTFVLAPKNGPSLVELMTSFADDMDALGIPYRTEVLSKHVAPASAELAEALRVQAGTPLFALERLRYVRGEPFCVTLAYILPEMCPSLDQVDFRRDPLFSTIRRRYGYHIARANRSLQAVSASAAEAEALSVPEGSPLLSVEDVVYLDDGRPIMVTKSRLRGDRSEFSFDVRFRATA